MKGLQKRETPSAFTKLKKKLGRKGQQLFMFFSDRRDLIELKCTFQTTKVWSRAVPSLLAQIYTALLIIFTALLLQLCTPRSLWILLILALPTAIYSGVAIFMQTRLTVLATLTTCAGSGKTQLQLDLPSLFCILLTLAYACRLIFPLLPILPPALVFALTRSMQKVECTFFLFCTLRQNVKELSWSPKGIKGKLKKSIFLMFDNWNAKEIVWLVEPAIISRVVTRELAKVEDSLVELNGELVRFRFDCLFDPMIHTLLRKVYKRLWIRFEAEFWKKFAFEFKENDFLAKRIANGKYELPEIHEKVQEKLGRLEGLLSEFQGGVKEADVKPLGKMKKLKLGQGHHYFISFDLSKAHFNVGMKLIVEEFSWKYFTNMYEDIINEVLGEVRRGHETDLKALLLGEMKSIVLPCIQKFLRPLQLNEFLARSERVCVEAMVNLVCEILRGHNMEPTSIVIQTMDEGQIQLAGSISQAIRREISDLCERWSSLGIYWKVMESFYNPCEKGMVFRTDIQFYPEPDKEFHLYHIPPKEKLDFVIRNIQGQSAFWKTTFSEEEPIPRPMQLVSAQSV